MANTYRGGGTNKTAGTIKKDVPTRTDSQSVPTRKSTVPVPQTATTTPVGVDMMPGAMQPGAAGQPQLNQGAPLKAPPTRAVPTTNQKQHEQARVDFRDTGRFSDTKEVDAFLNGDAQALGAQAQAPTTLEGFSQQITGLLSPASTKPESFNSYQKYLDLRDEYKAGDLDSQAAELGAQIRELEDTTADRIRQEEGKSIAVGVQAGRISEIEQQQNLRNRELTRTLQVVNDQRTIANNTVSQIMGYAQTDYKNALDLWNTEYNQNLQATQMAMTAQRDQKAEERWFLEFNQAKEEREEDIQRDVAKDKAASERFQQEFGLSKERIQLQKDEQAAIQTRFESGQDLDRLKLKSQMDMQRATNALSAARIGAAEKQNAFNQMMSERSMQLKEQSQSVAAMQTAFNLAQDGQLGTPDKWTDAQIANNGQLENKLGVPQGTLANLSLNNPGDTWKTTVTDPVTGEISAVLMGADGSVKTESLSDGAIPRNVQEASNAYAQGDDFILVEAMYGTDAANRGSALYNKELALSAAASLPEYSSLNSAEKEKFNTEMGALYDAEMAKQPASDSSQFLPGGIGETFSVAMQNRLDPTSQISGGMEERAAQSGPSGADTWTRLGYTKAMWDSLSPEEQDYLKS